MLDEGSAELQCAAARVLGELKPKDPGVRKSLAGALKSPNETVRLYAVEALAGIDAVGALPHLVPLLAGPDAVRNRVTAILTEIGAAAAEPLRERLEKADPAVRKGILEVLGRLKGVDVTEGLFAGLLDSDLEVVKKAAQAYRQRLEGLSGPEKPKALRKILEFMESPRVQKLKTPLASCLLIVGAFRDASAVKPVLGYLDRKQPPAVRNHALLALQLLPFEGAAAKAVASRVLPLLSEGEINEIVRPALELLAKLEVGKEEAERLLKALKSAYPPVRLYALKALAPVGTSKVAEVLLEALQGADPGMAEAAGNSLRANPDFAPVLVKALDRSEEGEGQWRIANVLRTYRNVLEKAVVRRFLDSAFSMLSKKKSGFQVYVEVARAAAPDLVKSAALKKGRQLLAARKFEDAERFLRLLSRDDLATPESDLALAIAQLNLQRLDPATARGDRGNALSLFSKVARKDGFPFLKSLEKDAGLITPEGLLYLGFALIERPGPERDTGAEILKLVAKKYASKESGQVARQKLKTQGIG